MQKLTTLDFPGVVSALVFTQGCNFCCPYCHNAQLIPTVTLIPRGDEQSSSCSATRAASAAYPSAIRSTLVAEDEVLSFLAKRADLLDGVVITGGEPCLQPDIVDFCRKAKNLGYKVKIDTNGSLPGVLQHLVEGGLLDYVAVDVKTALENYAPLLTQVENAGEKLAATFALLAAHEVAYEARTTCVAPFVDESMATAMAALVKPNVPWYFQRANIEKPSAVMRALTDGEIHSLIDKLETTHPLARMRE